jgi:hypothetical protein
VIFACDSGATRRGPRGVGGGRRGQAPRAQRGRPSPAAILLPSLSEHPESPPWERSQTHAHAAVRLTHMPMSVRGGSLLAALEINAHACPLRGEAPHSIGGIGPAFRWIQHDPYSVPPDHCALVCQTGVWSVVEYRPGPLLCILRPTADMGRRTEKLGVRRLAGRPPGSCARPSSSRSDLTERPRSNVRLAFGIGCRHSTHVSRVIASHLPTSPPGVRKMSENAQRLPSGRKGIRAGRRGLPPTTNGYQRVPTERAYKETKKA